MFSRTKGDIFMILIFLLKGLLLLIALLVLLSYVSSQMRIKFPPGAVLALGVILTLLIGIPYAGWILAALFLLRFTTVMTNADFWPESTALALVIIPLLELLKHLLY